jgi:hypothetical protein
MIAMLFKPFQEDKAKLKELILYLAKKSEDDPKYGMTKLNKLLYFSDFFAYARTGKSITGSQYQRLGKGPCLRAMLPVRNEMLAADECAMQKAQYFGHQQDRLLALRDPDLSIFTGEEIAIVNEVLAGLREHNAREASDFTHRFPTWQAFDDKETIPYEAIFVTNRELTERERQHAKSIKPTRAA